MAKLRLGKKPAKHDPRTLRLTNFIDPLKLPPLRPVVDWTPAVMRGGGYPMYLNDRIGDCAIAAPGHLIQTWTANSGDILSPSDDDILRAYQEVGGYSPDDPTSDNGCVLLDVLKYWRKTGIAGRKIGAFVALDHHDPIELQYAIQLLGGFIAGLALPDSVVTGDLVENPWDDNALTPNLANGHAVVASTFDSTGVTFATWGTLKQASWRFCLGVGDEAYAIFSEDWIDSEGTCPAGLKRDELLAALTAITR